MWAGSISSRDISHYIHVIRLFACVAVYIARCGVRARRAGQGGSAAAAVWLSMLLLPLSLQRAFC